MIGYPPVYPTFQSPMISSSIFLTGLQNDVEQKT